MQDARMFCLWICTGICLFALSWMILQYFYNFSYSQKVKRHVMIYLECLQKPHDMVRLSSLVQYKKFNPDDYLKNKINKQKDALWEILRIIDFNEREIARLTGVFHDIDCSLASKSTVEFYYGKIRDQAYISYQLLWNYTSPAGRNSYTNASVYDKKELEGIMNEEKQIERGFISMNEFENNWITRKYGNEVISGYQKRQICGCYVILVFDQPTASYKNYQDVYVGQSVNVYKRVHNHFNGKGNGDIYADAKYGKYIYVKIIPCEAGEMNQMEKELISFYNATDSYNKTSGGGVKRQ